MGEALPVYSLLYLLRRIRGDLFYLFYFYYYFFAQFYGEIIMKPGVLSFFLPPHLFTCFLSIFLMSLFLSLYFSILFSLFLFQLPCYCLQLWISDVQKFAGSVQLQTEGAWTRTDNSKHSYSLPCLFTA